MSEKLYYNILPKEQMELWQELHQTPKQFTLYEGTALALQLGHMVSIDFDFFSNDPVNPSELQLNIPYLKNAEVQDSKPNTLTCLIYRDNKPIQVSYFGDLALPKINKDIVIDGVNIASCEDILTTKLKTIIDRPSSKDYIDIAAGLQKGYKLNSLLANTKKLYGPKFNNNLSLRALTYYKDIPGLDEQTKKTITDNVKHYERSKKSKKMQDNIELLEVARKVVWFQPPEETLKNKKLFLTHLMRFGTEQDTDTVRKHYTKEDFIEVLQNPEIGVFDERSWHYWHLVFLDKTESSVPDIPKRTFL